MLNKILKNRWFKVLIAIHSIVLIILVALFFYIRHTTVYRYEEAVVTGPYDAIIVPGYPFKDSTWHDIMKARVHWSRYLFEKGYTKNIIYSGSAVYSPFVEAEVMKTYAVALGLPESQLHTEPKAEHSTENLYYSLKIADNLGFKKVALATDPFQSFFLMRFAEDQGYDLSYLPIQFDTLDKMNLTDPKIDPTSAFVPNFVALPDREGFVERFKGTLGHKIPGRVN